jgi:hypothetical protein
MRCLRIGTAVLAGCLSVGGLVATFTLEPRTWSPAPGPVLVASGGVDGATAEPSSNSIGALAQHVAAPASRPPTHKAVASPGSATAKPPRQSVSARSSVPPRAAPGQFTSTTFPTALRPARSLESSKPSATTTTILSSVNSGAGNAVTRAQPSIAAIEAAIQGLKPYLHTVITPSVAQVDEMGNEVCSAFDQGNTYSQVVAAVTQSLLALPWTEVLPGAGEYVVDTAVSLYCPGHGAKRA